MLSRPNRLSLRNGRAPRLGGAGAGSLLKGIVEASGDGILVISTEGKILSFNDRFLELWRFSRRITAHRSDEEALRSAVQRVSNPDGFIARVRYLYQHPHEESLDEIALTDGVRFERYGAPLVAGGKLRGRVWFFRDRTAAEHAASARDERLAAVIHDLRTPIQNILLQSRMLREHGSAHERATVPTVPTIPRALERIERNAGRLAGLVNDLFEATRLDQNALTLRLEPIALAELVRALVDEIRASLRDHAVELRIEGPVPLVCVDRLRFAQILTNLLDNAAKYSPEGAPIEVVLAPCEGGTTVGVRDRGVGIASADLPRLFDRFFQTKEARARGLGVGLGLFITKTLVDMQHGRLTVESEPGRGSTFRVFLPAAAGDCGAARS
jgi:signal transduction histidine kinase